MIFVAILWFVLTFVIGVAAERRGRSGFGWFLLALFLSPLIAGILLAVFPDRNLRALLEEPRRTAAVDERALLRNIERDGSNTTGSTKGSLLLIPAFLIGALLLLGFIWIGWSNKSLFDSNKQNTALTTQAETNKKNEVSKQVVHTPPPPDGVDGLFSARPMTSSSLEIPKIELMPIVSETEQIADRRNSRLKSRAQISDAS